MAASWGGKRVKCNSPSLYRHIWPLPGEGKGLSVIVHHYTDIYGCLLGIVWRGAWAHPTTTVRAIQTKFANPVPELGVPL